jgi:hypothetical protein
MWVSDCLYENMLQFNERINVSEWLPVWEHVTIQWDDNDVHDVACKAHVSLSYIYNIIVDIVLNLH